MFQIAMAHDFEAQRVEPGKQPATAAGLLVGDLAGFYLNRKGMLHVDIAHVVFGSVGQTVFDDRIHDHLFCGVSLKGFGKTLDCIQRYACIIGHVQVPPLFILTPLYSMYEKKDSRQYSINIAL